MKYFIILCSLALSTFANESYKCDNSDSLLSVTDNEGMTLSEYHCVNGKVSGSVTQYCADGYASMVQEFKNGKLNGMTVWLNESGDTVGTAIYKNDKLVGKKKCADGRKGDETLDCY